MFNRIFSGERARSTTPVRYLSIDVAKSRVDALCMTCRPGTPFHPLMLRVRRITIWIMSSLLILTITVSPARSAPDDFLSPEQAFHLSARMVDANTVEATYAIAAGYYMYRERFRLRADGAALGTPIFPAGQVKFDDTFQKNVETYHHSVRIIVPVDARADFTLIVTGQGCAEKGLCYPPMESRIRLKPIAAGAPRTATPAAADTFAQVAPETGTPGGAGMFEAAIRGGKLSVMVPLFFLAGLALSFTPCVLPMVPILSSIIVGDGGTVSRKRGFALSASYAAGMALVYTAMGLAAGWIGEGLAASLQKPWILAGFSGVIALLALSLFDLYRLQMPAAIQTRLMQASNRQAAGKFAGVFAMGALSGLVVGPCVAAPLIGVLIFISKTRDLLLGGAALFSIAAGMSVPLLLVGVSAGWLLPRAGAWMETIKRFFGFVLLGVALWTISPIIPAWGFMLGLASLFAACGADLLLRHSVQPAPQILGIVCMATALAELIGAVLGGQDALAPLELAAARHESQLPFVRVASSAQLDMLMATAPGKPAMLDFYADWCVSCKEMEKLTFTDSRVRARMTNMFLLQADVTANTAEDQILLKRFRLYGPPGIVFFDERGREMEGLRIVGFQKADEFLSSLARVSHSDARR